MTMQVLLALLAAPFALAVVVVCLREPMRVALPLYAAVIPFGGLLSIGSSKFSSLSSLIGIVLGVGLLLHLPSNRRTSNRLSITVPLWLAFLGIAGITILWSITPVRTVNSFVILGSLIIVYVLIAMSPVDRGVLRRVENGLIIGGLAAVAYGLFQLAVLGGFPDDPFIPGAPRDGRFGNDLLGPNNQAVALMLPLLVSLSRSVTVLDAAKRVQYAGIAALLLGGILMTGSRGGILATFVAVGALVASTPRGRSRLVSYSAVGLVIAGFVWIVHPFGLAERTTESATSSSGRTDIWQVGLAACPDYCPSGSGWGTFPDVYAQTQAEVAGASVLVGGGAYEAHNVWLLVIIELGVVGLLLLIAALLASTIEAARLPGDLRGPPMSALIATVFAASFLSNLEFKFFWMALILVVMSRNLSTVHMAHPPSPSRAIDLRARRG
jgi:O-antigen ligase